VLDLTMPQLDLILSEARKQKALDDLRRAVANRMAVAPFHGGKKAQDIVERWERGILKEAEG